MFSPGACLSLSDSSSIKCPGVYFSLLHTNANRASWHCYCRNRNPGTHTKPSPVVFRYIQRRPVQTWRDSSSPDHPGEEIRNGREPTSTPLEWEGGKSVISDCLLSSYMWPRNETFLNTDIACMVELELGGKRKGRDDREAWRDSFTRRLRTQALT